MNWAIERDDEGVPVRMWWMGPEKREPREIMSLTMTQITASAKK